MLLGVFGYGGSRSKSRLVTTAAACAASGRGTRHYSVTAQIGNAASPSLWLRACDCDCNLHYLTYSALPSSTACFCRPEFGRAFETALREATPESPASFLSSRFFPRPHCARILLGSTPRSSCATVIDPATPAAVRSNSISRTPLTTTCYDLLAPRTILQLCLPVSLLSSARERACPVHLTTISWISYAATRFTTDSRPRALYSIRRS